jgi:hypothetical protein
VQSHLRASRRTTHGASSTGPAVQREDDYLLDLQRRVGNNAVTLLVQRQAGDSPQPTRVQRQKKGGSKKAPPKKADDIKARVFKVEVDKGGSLITISAGSDRGVGLAMEGRLVTGDGKVYASFAIEKVEGAFSWAHVSATPDEIGRNPTVIIDPSTGMAGKEV